MSKEFLAMPSSFVGSLVDWLVNSINLELQMKVEDVQLMQIGFSFTETQEMTLLNRQQYLAIGSRIDSVRKYNELFKLADVGVVSNGFASKSSRNRVIRGWKSDVARSLSELNSMGIKTNRTRKRVSAKKKPAATISFKDKLKKFTQEKKHG